MRLKNQAKIKELLEKGVEKIYPSAQFLESALKSGKKLTLYLGIDPTGPELHLGHSIPLMKLRAFQDLGHHIILLIGNFTALSGDPDKSHTRKRLTQKEISENIKNYKKQIGKILDLKGDNPVEFKYNADWLAKLTFKEVTEIASYFTVQQMISRDLFDRRIKDGNPIALHEFFYPLMQAYDSVAMNVDGEIGGNDQTFNMLCGRDLMKAIKNKEKFVLTMKLLADSTGKKMGKTEGNIVNLDEVPENMYGQVMSWPDGVIEVGLELCTNLPMAEVKDMVGQIKNGKNPRDIKMRLAYEITKINHGEKKAKEAEEYFIKTVQKKETPEEVKIIKVNDSRINIIQLLALTNLAFGAYARGLIGQGGIKVDGRVITFRGEIIEIDKKGVLLQKGKREFIKVVLK